MSILNQIKKSQLSKQGQTNPTGVFEGVPANAAIVTRQQSFPRSSYKTPKPELPVDATFNAKPQPTYLDYMRAANKR